MIGKYRSTFEISNLEPTSPWAIVCRGAKLTTGGPFDWIHLCSKEKANGHSLNVRPHWGLPISLFGAGGSPDRIAETEARGQRYDATVRADSSYVGTDPRAFG